MNLQSRSQSGQDIWVFEMTEHKTSGFYVDIGCNDPEFHSNTFALEQMGWNGLLVDVVGGCEKRKGVFVLCDATRPNDRLKFNYDCMPTVVDFLSLDVDDALIPVFTSIPWDHSIFRTICLEHDTYRKGEAERDKTRVLLKAMGYILVCADVCVDWPNPESRSPYEDWWCSPEHVNPDLIKRYQSEGAYWKDIISR